MGKSKLDESSMIIGNKSHPIEIPTGWMKDENGQGTFQEDKMYNSYELTDYQEMNWLHIETSGETLFISKL